MAQRGRKALVEFFNVRSLNSLTEDEKQKAELTSMMVLAADFLNGGRVNKAEHLRRISKISVPIYLSKTKAGGYLAVNPSSDVVLKVPLMQLISLQELTETLNKSGIDLDKIKRKLMKFNNTESELRGGVQEKNIKYVKALLDLPMSDRNDFYAIKPILDASTLKSELKNINDLAFDKESLSKNIDDRLDLIEKAIADEAAEIDNNYKTRSLFWEKEIASIQKSRDKQIKDRDTELDKDLASLEKETEKKVTENIRDFLRGVAKNIRKDEKPVEKVITDLEKLSESAPDSSIVGRIEKSLEILSDNLGTLRAAVDFAKSQVNKVQIKERDIIEIKELDKQNFIAKAEKDKTSMAEEYADKEVERDKELAQLKEDRDKSNLKIAQFKDQRNQWKNEIEAGIITKGTAMIDFEDVERIFPDAGKLVELYVPLYLFQYVKGDEIYTVTVPPVNMPDNFRRTPKNPFQGDNKTVSFELIVPELDKFIGSWIEKNANQLDLSNAINQAPNLLDNPTLLRDTFFNSQSLMVDKLKVDSKKIKKANDSLTFAFSSA